MKKLLLSLAVLCGASVAFAGEVQDVLTVDLFNITKETTYTDVKWTSEATGITYEGNMAKSNKTNGGGMQFRYDKSDNNKRAGLVATANPKGAILKSVNVEVATVNKNTWNVYGNTAVYSSYTELRDEATAGKLLDSGTTTKMVTPTEENLVAFGFRSNLNALYIKQITITYEIAGESGKKAADLSFPEQNYLVGWGEAFEAPKLTKATTAEVAYESSNTEVATVDKATGEVKIVGVGTTTITASAEANDEFYAGSTSYTLTVAKLKTVEKTTAMADGNFVMVANGHYNSIVPADKTYGYLSTVALPENADAKFAADEAYLLTFTAVDGGYNITNSRGAMLGAKSGFKTFDYSDESAANRVWTVELTDEGAVITNVGINAVVYLDPQFNSFGVYTAEQKTDKYILPTLYNVPNDPTAIENVEAENADAPVEYFNLQGVKVANPSNGLYIRRQGNKVEKVVIR